MSARKASLPIALSLPAALSLALALAACGDARSLAGREPVGSGCTMCHGGYAGDASGAPPFDRAGGTATSEITVGAHAAHVKSGPLAGPFACDACHPDPRSGGAATHRNGAVDLQWGATATAQGASASPAAPWAAGTSPTCTNYCHGAKLDGGSHTAPVWTSVGAGEADCGTCHGLPPATLVIGGPGNHPAVAGAAPEARRAQCYRCHAGTVDSSGNVLASGGLHVNGAVDLSATGCTSCHGGGDNPTGAPPLDLAGNSATSAAGVGAHSAHVQDGPLARAFACTQCHPDPRSGSATHADGSVDLDWAGGIAGNGTTPTPSAPWPVGTTPTCTNYCHGATLGQGAHTEPVWTSVGLGEADCGDCHGLPPTAGHGAGVQLTQCTLCHAGTVDAGGAIKVAGGLHVNGNVEAFAHGADWFVDPNVNGAFAPAGGLHTTAVNGQGISPCTSCHGADLEGGVSGVSCNACHSGYAAMAGWTTNCVLCHGGKDITGAAANGYGAPPWDVAGSSATTSVTVGAHTSHFTSPHGLWVAPANLCQQCHGTLPTDVLTPGHIDGSTAVPLNVALGAATSAGGWTSPTCATYCHGGTSALVGGAATAPDWTIVNGSQVGCGSCHGAPPDTGWHDLHVLDNDRNCSNCHAGIATGSGTAAPITNGAILSGGRALHVDGAVNVVLSTGKTWNGTGWFSGCGASVCH